jgi:hypothetical protein
MAKKHTAYLVGEVGEIHFRCLHSNHTCSIMKFIVVEKIAGATPTKLKVNYKVSSK